MRFFEFATAVTAIGCGTGVIISTVDKVMGGRRRVPTYPAAQAVTAVPAVHVAQSRDRDRDRVRFLEAEVAALRLQNEQLKKELEWHTRLLERSRPEPLPSGR